MLLNRRLTTAALGAVVSLALAACGSDSTGPSKPQPILGLTATPKGATSVQLTFNSVAGDNSYSIERAEGSGGTFASVTSVTAPATPGQVSYTDNGLQPTTLYRYRVITVKGTQQSIPSGEAQTTTLAFGNASADLTTDITADKTLYADTVYTLKGFIHVANGATLTIQPGTKIQGDFNTLGSSLWILRGAKINAVGTASAPIVLTSSRTTGRQPGDWGGLLIIGNAIDNRSGSVEVEGSGTDGTTVVGGKNYQVLYSGGTTATDNSGTLSYVRVEFAGFAPSLNNELNSFTFAAVGSGTRASYLQSMGGLDDSYEFFGGGFDLDHLVAYETGDDMFDMSEGFVGRLQFLIGYNSLQLTPRTGAGSLATDLEGIENDGCQGSGCDNGFNQQPYTVPLVANFTMVGCGDVACVGSGGGHGMMIRRGSGGFYLNGVVARFPRDGVSLRDAETYARGGSVAVPDPATSDLQIRNTYFTEINNTLFQAGGGSTIQNSLDAAGNNLTNGSATAVSLFAKLPAQGVAPTGVGDFDWTPAAGSAITTGGLAPFTGKMATKAGTTVTATNYLGAADPAGAKWWTGWTVYFRN
ncbi:MAG TPA: fibronectin type III domain-containing protein [Gemmatimonadaceae bacterium]|nr:fibronectin type III domain-containing protein [Gemmatimonadaceae bacterium]